MSTWIICRPLKKNWRDQKLNAFFNLPPYPIHSNSFTSIRVYTVLGYMLSHFYVKWLAILFVIVVYLRMRRQKSWDGTEKLGLILLESWLFIYKENLDCFAFNQTIVEFWYHLQHSTNFTTKSKIFPLFITFSVKS